MQPSVTERPGELVGDAPPPEESNQLGLHPGQCGAGGYLILMIIIITEVILINLVVITLTMIISVATLITQPNLGPFLQVL